VVLNIGFKSDGLISLNEFRDQPNLKIGDEVEVMVVDKEDRNGHLNLSRRQARITRAWERIMEVHKTGEVITGTVTSKTKGGLIVDVFGMENVPSGFTDRREARNRLRSVCWKNHGVQGG
jgi:small subunit ribosomal protein S1